MLRRKETEAEGSLPKDPSWGAPYGAVPAPLTWSLGGRDFQLFLFHLLINSTNIYGTPIVHQAPVQAWDTSVSEIHSPGLWGWLGRKAKKAGDGVTRVSGRWYCVAGARSGGRS